ncbi:MAG: succinate dehydrogenase cytochrome b subunit [Akkermansiaceae bacterium]|jgi:succinate dehydrogenase / fumarate reductase cytochrome b subunit|tara:strand:+ start:294 stop:986 length:693 start_codon:yes stop_codon:yes gene_type:complete
MSASSCSLCAVVKSSIGRKIIVALTGLALVLFLAGHLAGNLLIYAGPDAFNEYAHFLHTFLHGMGVWIARIGLLVCLVLHVWFTILLTKENKAARPKYAHDATVQAPKSSRMMIWSGLTILAFIVYHLLHFTIRIDSNLAKMGETSPWHMVIEGFQNPLVVIFYVIAMTLLCSHLSHGVASIFQTLGLRSKKTAGPIKFISKAYAVIVYLGFISIPLAVLLFGFGCEACK